MSLIPDIMYMRTRRRKLQTQLHPSLSSLMKRSRGGSVITTTAAADFFSDDDILDISVEDPNATNTKRVSPKNRRNIVGIDNVTNGSGGTTTASNSPHFSAITRVSLLKMFERPNNNNNNGLYLKGGGHARNP